MKYRQLIVILVMLITCSIGSAQTDKPTIQDDFKPSTLNQPGQEYPPGQLTGICKISHNSPRC